MAMKVKAVERLVKFNKNDAGTYRYVMAPEMYSSLAQDKVIKESALRSGVSKGVMQACWDSAGEVIKAWATEGIGPAGRVIHAHSVKQHSDVMIDIKKMLDDMFFSGYPYISQNFLLPLQKISDR